MSEYNSCIKLQYLINILLTNMLWEEHISVFMCGYTCNVLFDLMRCFPLQCAATGKVVKLSEPAEEVATFYARMLDHDYTTKDVFNNNFTKDWKKVLFTCSFCETVEFVSKLSYVWKLSTSCFLLQMEVKFSTIDVKKWKELNTSLYWFL